MYSVKHKEKSVALIFNHKHFDKITSRDGSEKDEEVLREVLKGFDARFYTDCTVNEIEEKLAGVAKEDHNDRDCLLVIVMTHGDRKNEIYAKDGPYHSSKLWSKFTPKNVSSLAGKPKIFLIQSCRGRNTDGGWQKDSNEKDYYFPTHPDFLIVHATMEG